MSKHTHGDWFIRSIALKAENDRLREINGELLAALEAVLNSDGSRGIYDAAKLMQARVAADAAILKAKEGR